MDQRMKSVYFTKKYSQIIDKPFLSLQHVPPISITDMEYYISMTPEDMDKYFMTVSRIGRLLRDDLQLQALYHMVVLLTPTSHNNLQTQQNESLLRKRNSVVQLLYRYFYTCGFSHICPSKLWLIL